MAGDGRQREREREDRMCYQSRDEGQQKREESNRQGQTDRHRRVKLMLLKRKKMKRTWRYREGKMAMFMLFWRTRSNRVTS